MAYVLHFVHLKFNAYSCPLYILTSGTLLKIETAPLVLNDSINSSPSFADETLTSKLSFGTSVIEKPFFFF